MRKYEVIRTNQIYIGLKNILLYKAQYSVKNAIAFRNKTLQEIDGLETFPNVWKLLKDNFRAKIIDGCLLVFQVDEEMKKVFVLDIVDPKQGTIAGKYY